MVRTSPFHGCNRGSNPLGDASKSPKHYSYASECNAAVFYDRKFLKIYQVEIKEFNLEIEKQASVLELFGEIVTN